MQVELTAEQETQLSRLAKRSGKDAAELVKETVLRMIEEDKVTSAATETGANESAARFSAWVDNFPQAPLLSDEAISRETLYPDR